MVHDTGSVIFLWSLRFGQYIIFSLILHIKLPNVSFLPKEKVIQEDLAAIFTSPSDRIGTHYPIYAKHRPHIFDIVGYMRKAGGRFT